MTFHLGTCYCYQPSFTPSSTCRSYYLTEEIPSCSTKNHLSRTDTHLRRTTSRFLTNIQDPQMAYTEEQDRSPRFLRTLRNPSYLDPELFSQSSTSHRTHSRQHPFRMDTTSTRILRHS